MSTKSLARKRQRLWQENPRCSYCGIETIYKPAHIKSLITPTERDRLATIDHIRPRHHPDRTKKPEPGQVLLVLACHKCNNERDRRELAAKPKEWFEERGGQPPLRKRPIEQLESILSRLGVPYQIGYGRRAREKWNKIKRCQIDVLWALWERGVDDA